jgi:hypothetical protein
MSRYILKSSVAERKRFAEAGAGVKIFSLAIRLRLRVCKFIYNVTKNRIEYEVEKYQFRSYLLERTLL